MLAGRVMEEASNSSSTLTLDNIQIVGTQEASVNAPKTPCVGGLIGYCGTGTYGYSNLTVTNCGYQNLTVHGLSNVGGLVGFLRSATVNITYFNGTSGDIQAKGLGYFRQPNSNDFPSKNNSDTVKGVGGLIGIMCLGDLTASAITLDGLEVGTIGDSQAKELGIGGLVGMLGTKIEGTVSISNVTETGTTLLESGSSTNASIGALVGYLSDAGIVEWSSPKNQNVTISNINLATGQDDSLTITGRQVGGILGLFKSSRDTTKNIGSLNMSQITIGSSNSTVTITSDKGGYNPSAASLVGILCNKPVFNVSNVTLKNNKISKAKYSGLIVGKAEMGGALINVTKVLAEKCTVTSSDYQGLLYGVLPSGTTMNGYNILIRSSTLSTSNNMGLWGGNGTAYLVAVNAIGCTGATKEFNNNNDYSKSPVNYAIRANFTTDADSVGSLSLPIMPESNLGTLTYTSTSTSFTVTGDGAAFYPANSTVSIANTILGKIGSNDGFTYNNVTNTVKINIESAGASITSYSGADGKELGEGRNDFPVLLLPAKTRSDVTTAIYNYLTILTNQPEAFWQSYLSTNNNQYIKISTFQWNTTESKYVQTDASLRMNGSQIEVTPGKYDNLLDQFTLLDISFPDPTGLSAEVFHLYVPIVVQKLLHFKFWAAVSEGTNYTYDSYNDLSVLAIGSHGEQFTMLFGYELLYSADEWQGMVDNGENLLWNFKKIINLTDSLPANTRLTLVDRNQGNRAYFVRSGLSGTVDLETVFKSGGWEQQCLCDMLSLDRTQANNGSFFLLPNNDSTATLRIRNEEKNNYDYYRPATDKDDPSGRYNIKVKEGITSLLETYYLTIQTDAEQNTYHNIYFSCNDKLESNSNTYIIPTQRDINTEGVFKDCRNGDENHLILGNFFTQNLVVGALTSPEDMTGSPDKTLRARLTMTITPNEVDNFGDFTTRKRLYPQFELYLKDQANNNKPIPAGTILSASYYIGDELKFSEYKTLGETSLLHLSGFLEQHENGESGFPAKDAANELNIRVEVALTYDSDGILDQFPLRHEGGSEGVNIHGTSYLSYSSKSLSNSRKNASDPTRYYRQSANLATLVYTQESVDQLGINGLQGDSFGISSVAYYSSGGLAAAVDADSIQCVLEFYRKEKNGSGYLSTPEKNIPNTASFVIDGNTLSPDENGICPLGDYSVDPNIPITISIPLTIATRNAPGFSKYYSNYKVKLTVSLWDGDKKIPGSEASDYIIYTNAKILTTLVQVQE